MLISSKCFRFSGSRARKLQGRGFTLVELLVVLAIVTVLTALILFQHRRFDSSTLLRSLAYSVGLSVRTAQIYGTSVRQFSGSFNYSYGLYFSGTTSYILFADVNPNRSYDSSPVDEKVQQFNIGTGYSIQTYCGMNGTGMECSAACPATLPTGITTCNAGTLTWFSVYFKRPNPDAQFSSSSGGIYSAAYIEIVGPSGGTATRGVTITSTGQVSVGVQGS
jgi:prepilin-type N-terminal cleavage/methylation domain-containing protein